MQIWVACQVFCYVAIIVCACWDFYEENHIHWKPQPPVVFTIIGIINFNKVVEGRGQYIVSARFCLKYCKCVVVASPFILILGSFLKKKMSS